MCFGCRPWCGTSFVRHWLQSICASQIIQLQWKRLAQHISTYEHLCCWGCLFCSRPGLTFKMISSITSTSSIAEGSVLTAGMFYQLDCEVTQHAQLVASTLCFQSIKHCQALKCFFQFHVPKSWQWLHYSRLGFPSLETFWGNKLKLRPLPNLCLSCLGFPKTWTQVIIIVKTWHAKFCIFLFKTWLPKYWNLLGYQIWKFDMFFIGLPRHEHKWK